MTLEYKCTRRQLAERGQRPTRTLSTQETLEPGSTTPRRTSYSNVKKLAQVDIAAEAIICTLQRDQEDDAQQQDDIYYAASLEDISQWSTKSEAVIRSITAQQVKTAWLLLDSLMLIELNIRDSTFAVTESGRSQFLNILPDDMSILDDTVARNRALWKIANLLRKLGKRRPAVYQVRHEQMHDRTADLETELEDKISGQASTSSQSLDVHATTAESDMSAMDVDIEEPEFPRMSASPNASFNTPMRPGRQPNMGLPTPDSNDGPVRRRLSGQSSLPVVDSPSLNRGTEASGATATPTRVQLELQQIQATEARAHAEEVERQNASLEEENRNLHDRLNQATSDHAQHVHALQRHLQGKEAEARDLRDQVQDLQWSVLMDEYHHDEERIAFTARLRRAEAELASLQNENDFLSNQLHLANDRTTHLVTEMDMLQADIQARFRKIQGLERAVLEKEEEMEVAELAHQAHDQRINEELSRARNDLLLAQQRKERAQRQRDELRIKLAGLLSDSIADDEE